jgi:uncharacterized phage protein gp47/JayE
MSKTFDAIVASMKAFIYGNNPSIDTSEGTILNDVSILAPSREISQLYDSVDVTSDAQSINTTNSSALIGLAANVGLVPKGARKARGLVTFFSNASPVSNITIPVGAIVSTASSNAGSGIQFVTTKTAVMYAAQASTYYNTLTGKYEISVDIEAIQAGTNGVIGTSTIVTLITVISGINGCYNQVSTTGGLDAESDESLRLRISSKWSGSSIGTEDSYYSTVIAQSGVADAKVLGHGETGRGDYGCVDIYIKGQIPRSQNDTFLTSAAFFSDVVLTKQPVIDDASLVVQSSINGQILSTSVWELVKDVGVYGGSIQAQDKISWITPQSSSNGTMYITYSQNGLIEDLQNIFSKTNKDVLDTSILVKEAREISIDITFQLKVLPGFDSNTVKSLIQTAVAEFLNALEIGAEVQQADIARVVLNVPGVDDMLLPFDLFQSSDSSILRNSFNNLVIPVYSYASVGTITITVIV